MRANDLADQLSQLATARLEIDEEWLKATRAFRAWAQIMQKGQTNRPLEMSHMDWVHWCGTTQEKSIANTTRWLRGTRDMVWGRELDELTSVLLRKAEANQIRWEPAGEGRYSVFLDPLTLTVGEHCGADKGCDAVFEIVDESGRRRVFVELKTGDPGYDKIQKLRGFAVGDNAPEKLLESLTQRLNAATGEIGRHPESSPDFPVVPQRPSEEQARLFFEKIAGNWDLDVSSGNEKVSIDEYGNYFGRVERGGKPIASEVRPRFRLALVATDKELSKVELAKMELNGRTRQIEVLAVTPEAMHGYAKHDEHRLSYRRQR